MRPHCYTVELAPVWGDATERAAHRTMLAERTRSGSTRMWTRHWNLIGVLGEWTFALVTGQPMRPEGKRSVCDGGGDWDLGHGKINVKARRGPSMSFLHPVGDPITASWYVLTVVSLRLRRGHLLGVVTPEMIRAAPDAPLFQAPKAPAVVVHWLEAKRLPEWMFT